MLLPSVRSKGKRLKLIEHVPDTVYYVLPSLFLPLYGDTSYILPNMFFFQFYENHCESLGTNFSAY